MPVAPDRAGGEAALTMQAAEGEHRRSTARAEEIAKFDRLAGSWWDPDGPMAPLHRMNPARIGWIARR